MRIIFLEDVPGSGRAGEVKEVKNGYARNYLLPRKLASLATHDQLQRIETIRKVADEHRIKEEKELGALAELLSQFTVNLTAKMGPTGRFYGAITSTQIAEELSRLADREIHRRAVFLEEPIREPGEFQAEIRFAHGITTTIPVTVVAEGAEMPETAEEEKQPEAAVDQLEQAEETEHEEESVTAKEEAVDQLEQAEETEHEEESVTAKEEAVDQLEQAEAAVDQLEQAEETEHEEESVTAEEEAVDQPEQAEETEHGEESVTAKEEAVDQLEQVEETGEEEEGTKQEEGKK